MKPQFSVEDVVMHRGAMSLLDEIIDYDDTWLRANVNIRKESMFAQASGVPAWIGMEYLAQAIGAFEGVRRRLQGGKPKLGFLVGSRSYVCSVDYFAFGQVLSLYVVQEMQAENGLGVFRCELSGQGVTAQANLNVYQPEDADQFLRESML